MANYNIDVLVDLYNKGFSVFEISLELDLSPSKVYRLLKKAGVKFKSPKMWTCEDYLKNYKLFRAVLIARLNDSNLQYKDIVRQLKRYLKPSTAYKYAHLLYFGSKFEIESQLRKPVLKCSKALLYYKRFINPVIKRLER